MAYEDIPRKAIEIRDGSRDGFRGHDALLDEAEDNGRFGVRTDIEAESVGYLGVDDIDRIRRKNLKHRTR